MSERLWFSFLFYFSLFKFTLQRFYLKEKKKFNKLKLILIWPVFQEQAKSHVPQSCQPAKFHSVLKLVVFPNSQISLFRPWKDFQPSNWQWAAINRIRIALLCSVWHCECVIIIFWPVFFILFHFFLEVVEGCFNNELIIDE